MVFQQAQQAIRWWLRRLDTHPLTVTGATVGGFTVTGLVSWSVLEWFERRRGDSATNDQKNMPMSLEEARLRAMIENAQTSSWQENLENASSAQEQFMLPGRPHRKPNFMEKIDKRSVEIMKAQHDELEDEQKRQKERDKQIDTSTRMWNS